MSAIATFFRNITLGQARAVLFATWLLGALAVSLFFAFHSLWLDQAGGAPGGWEWLAPTIGPMLSIVATSAVINALERSPAEDRRLARPIAFYAALLWSLIYFATLAGSIAVSERWGGAFVSVATLFAAMQIVLATLLAVFLAAKQT